MPKEEKLQRRHMMKWTLRNVFPNRFQEVSRGIPYMGGLAVQSIIKKISAYKETPDDFGF